MSEPHTLYLAGATNNLENAVATAARLGGVAYVDARDPYDHLPFRALVTVATDNLEDLEQCSDVGLYLVCQRVIKPGSASHYGLFPMIHHADKSHTECDSHWRDNHAPLALEHHPYMSHYLQLSVVVNMSGRAFDGFALCGFASEEDLRERFYVSDEGVRIIAEDIAKFADLKRSPRRLIAKPSS